MAVPTHVRFLSQMAVVTSVVTVSQEMAKSVTMEIQSMAMAVM